MKATSTDDKFTDFQQFLNLSSIGRKIALPRIPLCISERKVLLGLLDLLMLNGALLIILWLRLGEPLSWRTISSHPAWFALLSTIWLIFASAFDAYDLRNASRLPMSILCVAKAALLTLSLYVLIPYITPYLLRSRLTLGLFAVYTLASLSFGRALYVFSLTQPIFRRRALVVGAGLAGRIIARAVRENVSCDYQLVGFIDDDPAKRGKIIEGTPVLGDHRDLVPLAKELGVSEVILAITHFHQIREGLFRALMGCQEMGLQIVPMPVLYERATGMVPVEHIGRMLHVILHLDYNPTAHLYEGLKRALDILIALAGLAVLGILLPFVAPAIYINSPGPIFYAQERVGKAGKVFRLFKLRTMVPNAEEDGRAVWARKGDERVTKVGRFLRATHIDELPQFINVLKGEMSVVGPRPERPEFVARLEKEIPFYRLRHSVRPGMAGWALVKQGYSNSVEDTLVKLQYDLYYIKHRSIYLDLLILLKAIGDVLTFRGT